MKRFVLSILLAGISSLIAAGANAADAPTACAVLSKREAVALTGGSLGEVLEQETKPTDVNGQDHATVCGYFPKGYSFD